MRRVIRAVFHQDGGAVLNDVPAFGRTLFVDGLHAQDGKRIRQVNVDVQHGV